ncbi:hypothetical protein [Catenuloplanes japonicus]|uniref:hypothetical protein n=1 Tax=Catenuloplanes japonicus TaxID=33876 RepID=UPI0006922E65|nr:hypothetical protein [Catenuloplanes japonicus]
MSIETGSAHHGAAPRTWTITVNDPGCGFLTANVRGHSREKARVTKAWRDVTYQLAQYAKLPTGLHRIRVDAIIRPTTNRGRDILGNWTDAAKPSVDALGPAFVRGGKKPAHAPGIGMIPDDNPTHLDGPYPHLGSISKPVGSLTLVIVDLSQLHPTRTWSPDLPVDVAEDRRITAKRACNGCGLPVGDVLNAEVEAALAGRPLPDVRRHCLVCKVPTAGAHRDEQLPHGADVITVGAL